MLGGRYILVHLSLVPDVKAGPPNVRATLTALPHGNVVSGMIDVTVKPEAVEGLLIGDLVDASLRKHEKAE